MRLLPCSVAMPVRSVNGVMRVEMSEKPTNHVGALTAIWSQSRCGSRSMASSPPHGGITARTFGSTSIAVSSAARSDAGALT